MHNDGKKKKKKGENQKKKPTLMKWSISKAK